MRKILPEKDLYVLRKKFKKFHPRPHREFIHEFIVKFFCRDYNQIPVNILVTAVKRISNLKDSNIFIPPKDNELI